jgi:hypothetical protein
MTNTSVNQSALPNRASSSALRKLSRPMNCGATDAVPVSV